MYSIPFHFLLKTLLGITLLLMLPLKLYHSFSFLLITISKENNFPFPSQIINLSAVCQKIWEICAHIGCGYGGLLPFHLTRNDSRARLILCISTRPLPPCSWSSSTGLDIQRCTKRHNSSTVKKQQNLKSFVIRHANFNIQRPVEITWFMYN